MKNNLPSSDPRNLPTKSLRILAIEWSHEMPAEKTRRRQIKMAHKLSSLYATETVAYAIRERRRTRLSWRILERTGGRLDRTPPRWPTSGLDLPTKDERIAHLHQLRVEAVLAAYRHCQYRCPYASRRTESCLLTTDQAQVGITRVQGKSRSPYEKKWPVVITVPTDWRVRVQRRGLATLDGMMTLDAAPMDGAPAGVSLYAATWLVQGRGYTVTAEKGYIAIQGETSYHGATATKALAGLRRKVESAAWKAQVKTADLDHLVSRAGEIKVCVSDAKAIGACEYGIRSWCHAVGLDYEAGCATVTEVYAAYQREPRSEARAAILYAIRRRGRKLAA